MLNEVSEIIINQLYFIRELMTQIDDEYDNCKNLNLNAIPCMEYIVAEQESLILNSFYQRAKTIRNQLHSLKTTVETNPNISVELLRRIGLELVSADEKLLKYSNLLTEANFERALDQQLLSSFTVDAPN